MCDSRNRLLEEDIVLLESMSQSDAVDVFDDKAVIGNQGSYLHTPGRGSVQVYYNKG